MKQKLIEESLKRLLHGNSKDLNAYLLEVCSSEKVDDTKTELYIHMLRLDGNNRPRTNDFAQFVTDSIIDYCIPPSEIREAREKDAKNNTTTNIVSLYKKASGLLTDLKNTGEGGEIILSLIMQRVLGIPQLLCKMPLKTNSDVHYHGADGIYGNYDNDIKKFCLYWGESKLYKDIGQAVTDCFDSIKSLLSIEGARGTYRERDLTLLRDNLDFDNEELEKAIVSFFDPDDEDYLSLEYRGACLVGYDEEAYPSDFSVVESQIKEAIQNKICEFKKSIESRIKYRKLDSFVMKVIVVPFSKVDDFREAFLEVK